MAKERSLDPAIRHRLEEMMASLRQELDVTRRA
jgi:hypothetical protein